MPNDLPDYLIWANTRAARMLQDTPTGAGAGVLAHLLAAEIVWSARVLGEPMSCPLRPDWDLPTCLTKIPENAARYRQIMVAWSDTDEISYRNTQGQDFTSSVQDILLHVLAHGAYHRGQIAQAVRQAGGEVVDTDYILFRRQ